MKKVRQRSLAAVLVVALLVSMFGIFNFNLSADGLIDVGNYPALKGFVSGTAPSQEFWSYDMKDYGNKAAMQVSDTDFKAPTVAWDVDNERVTFDWAAVDGAASYTVNVYEGVKLADSFAGVTANTYSNAFAQTDLVSGTDYEAQVVAYDASGAVLSASCVRKFSAEAKPKYNYVIQDFNNTDSSVVYNVRDAREDRIVYDVADGKINITTITNSNAIYFSFPYSSANAFKDTTGNANYIYIKMATAPGFGSKTKPGFSTSLDGGKVSAVDSSVTYAKYANIYNVNLPSNRVSWNAVSVDNPNNAASVAMTGNSMGGYVPYAYDSLENGYYYVIPLNAYSATMQADIKAGTFDVFGLQFETALTYDTATSKYVTTAAAAPGKISIDEIGLITDYNAWLSQLQDEYDPVAADKKTAYAFEGDLGVLNADTFTASSDTLANAKFGSFYKFQNSATARRVTFTAVSSFTNQYGANLTFTAEEDGYYDLANKLEVVNNDSVTDATVNYRVIKRSSDGDEVVYPFDTSVSEWYGFNVSADNKNPSGDIIAPMVYLAAGEKLIIELYADIPAGGQLEINLGNPTMTLVDYSENYKGSTYEWSFGKYSPQLVYEDKESSGNFNQEARWDSQILHIDPETGAETYSEVPLLRNVNNMASIKVLYNDNKSSNHIGYYYYNKVADHNSQNMKIAVGSEYGISLQYTAPIDGTAVMSMVVPAVHKYRITVNGVQTYPASGWENGTTFSYPADVKAGDVISVDIMSKENFGNYYKSALGTVKVSPKVTMSTGNSANSVGDRTFAVLWERPYNGKAYTGDFAHLSGSLWNFKTSDFSSTSSIKSFDANYYSSTDKSLYYKDENGNINPNVKYIFADEQLKTVISEKNKGISLTFTATELGYYDFSTALNLLDGTYNAVNGAGTLKARILAGEETVWPASGDWYTAEKIQIGESIDISATEVFLGAGETIVLQIYAFEMTNVDGTESPKPMVIGLGSPAVQHIRTRIFTDTGSSTVYIPSDFTVMEPGYSGTYIPVDSRFNVTFGGKAPVSTDTATGTMSLDASNRVVYDPATGEMSLVISAGNTAAVEFVSPMDGTGTYEIATSAVSGAITYRLLKNGTPVKDWSATLPAVTDITAEKGDKFTLEINATSIAAVAFDTFNISLKGLHNNPNSASDTAFYAPFAVPYGNSDYTGAYTERADSYWKFGLYDVENDKTVKANYYDFDNNKKLYNKDMQNVGYYFAEQNNRMNADVYTSDTEKYGLSLGFAAPAANTFNFRSGLQLETNATATFMLRLIQVNAAGETTTVWPADTDSDGWYEQTVTQNEDIAIPHAEFTINEGDTVYLQLYAKESDVEALNISLASPGFMKDSPVTIEHADIGARIYDCTHYNPYKHFKHKGDFTTTNYVPMENRWNLEYINIDPATGEMLGVINPDYYRIGTSGAHELMYKGHNGLLWLNYHSNKTPMGIGRYEAESTYAYQYVGSQKRFIAPSTATYQIKAVTPTTKDVIEGGSVRYRITKVSAATGEETVLWPSQEAIESKTTLIWTSADGTAWEVLNNENLISKAEEFELDLEVGDQLKFQMYNYASTGDLDTYITNNPDLEKAKWSASGGVTPQIIVIDYINEKSIHSLNTGWMENYQLSPYWKIQSADGDGEPYRDNTRYSWAYWLDTKYSLIGISSLQKWNFQKYKENTWTDDIKPIISARFTFSSDGYLSTKGSAKFIGEHFVDEAQTQAVNIKARILLNGANLYPDSGWSTITNGTTFTYDVKNVEVKAGDELRYELMYDNGGDNVYISWNPSLTVNKYADIYNYTDDIYNLLTDEMTTYFKSLKSSAFEGANPLAKALSEAIKARKAAAAEIGPEYSGLFGDDGSDSDQVISGDPGDYREWTEEIYTPGGGYRKIRRTYITSWWIYALIIAGGVILIAGITVLTVILVKKKRKKSANKT